MNICISKEGERNCPISRIPCPGECIYSDILKNINVGIIVFDTTQNTIIFQNEACIELFQNAILPGDYQALGKMLLTGESHIATEPKILFFDGKYLGYTVYHIIKGYAWVFIRDISEKIKSEAKIKSAHRMTRAILESSPYGIFVVNNEFTIDYMNPTMLRMSSEEDEVVTGSSIHDISDYKNAGITDRIEETITSVSNFFLGPVEFTSPADGGTAFRNFLGFPLVDDSSIKALVFVEDVTERMRIEAQNALLAASVESAEEAFFITDAEGTIQYVNPAFERITGYHKGDVLSRKPSILKSGRHDEAFYRSLWEKLNRGEVWHGIFINKKKDGTLYEAETTIFPVKSSSGKILNFVASKRDVTEKNRLEAIAEAVNTMNNIGYIFTGIRHEIGNPINSTKMALSVLRNNVEKFSKVQIKEYTERALAELSRVEYLLHSLKSFTMYEDLAVKDVSVRGFMDSLLSLVRDDFEKNGVLIKTILHPEVTSVFVDPRALQQVMLNILTNALHALEDIEEPKIVINIFKRHCFITISIIDNGCGMTGDQMKDIFKPFYTTKEKGTGLGLVITKKMLTKMNCTMSITSEKHAGTIVDISIPEGRRERIPC